MSESNYGFLYNLRDDIARQSQLSVAFRFFNDNNIRYFFNKNKANLLILDNTLADLAKKYALHDEEGIPVLKEKNGLQEHTFLDKSLEDQYLKDFNEFMNKEVKIEL